MNTDPDATRRRHVREKSVIDHVARELFKPPPAPAAEKAEHPKSTTDTGLPVEEQVRKEWDPSGAALTKDSVCSLSVRSYRDENWRRDPPFPGRAQAA